MTDFASLGLSPATLKAVEDTGYTTPTPIQEQAIPVALAGRDVLGIAQTGTGKTAAFTLPMIDRLVAGRSKARMPRGLVIAPTRELADQVAESFGKYAKGQKLTWALLIGGVSMGEQVSKLDRGVDVLIATPGRLIDLFERGKMMLTGVQTMVVDEADRMLDMGFIPDLERIFKLTPPGKQTLFFSATMPPEITRLTAQFLRDPTRIEASRPATAAETISQYIVRIPSAEPKAKRMALRALAERADVKNGIVFCNRKVEVDVVAKSLKTHGLDASPIHGDLDQSLRTKTLDAFRKGDLKLLVASDVAARGLDIPAVSHVFNYDVPHHADDYIHRIGRTGRAGRTGQTFMIVTPADSRNLDKVLKLIKMEPEELTLDLDWSLAEGGEREGRSSSRGRSERPSRGRSESARPRRSAAAPAESRAPVESAGGDEEDFSRLDGETAGPVADAAPPARPTRARRARVRPAPVADAPTSDDAVTAAPPALARVTAPSLEPAPSPAPRPPREAEPVRTSRSTAYGRGGVREQAEPGEGRERGVVGFGSDTPAFLMAPLPARKPELVED